MGIRESASVVNSTLVEVLKQYSSTYPGGTATPLGQGNINDTFLVTASAGKFVLQRISAAVFREPPHVINNFCKISGHIRRKTCAIAPGWQFSRPVYTDCGDLFYKDKFGYFWRGQTYLPHKTVTMMGDSAQARELGQALGLFHLLMSDMDCGNLHDPLPGFHVLPAYLEHFDVAWKEKRTPGAEVSYCLEIINKYRENADLFERAKKAGILTEQPVHGDPKIDNFVFSGAGNCVGLIDLDTVGSGLIHFDLGDCLRSCCNLSGEYGQRDQGVRFDIDICREILGGYFQTAATLLSSLQRCYIFDALLFITFELGLRFFTDYLLGNRYFKIRAEDDNLQRAMIQFKLVGEIAKFEQEIRTIAEM